MDAPATLFPLAALNSDYAACIDADRLEDWPDFFLDDCLYKITTADNHRHGYAAGVIYADSRAMLRDRVAALREANIYERHTYRHIVGMPRGRDSRHRQRGNPVPGGPHDAGRAHGYFCYRPLPGPRHRQRRCVALRRTHRGLRQPALRYAAGDPAVARRVVSRREV
jgi:hypothetical protein